MGALTGVRVLEMEAIGPVPFCGMLLADMGADVIRVDRMQAAADLGIARNRATDVVARGRRSVALDLKSPKAVEAVQALATQAHILLEGFRPGVMERLGLGPEVLLKRSPQLVYGRMTGWGQSGPMAQAAGHDINYLAMSGMLSTIGLAGGKPVPPLNLVADYGGGAMMLCVGVLAALHHAKATGQGQVVDAAMVDGASLLGAHFKGLVHEGRWREERGSNLLDGGAPWYDTYQCQCGGYVAVGALEERFYLDMLQRMGLDPAVLPDRADRARWPALRDIFTQTFASRTREAWTAIFGTSDACVSPVLTLSESERDAHMRARGAFVTAEGVSQPAPAPRFSATPSVREPRVAPERGQGGRTALADWGFSEDTISAWQGQGVQAQP